MGDDTARQIATQRLPGFLTELSETEQQFLSGKRDRSAHLESAVRIFLEVLRGFEFFGGIDRPCVTIFGSARFAPGHRWSRGSPFYLVNSQLWCPEYPGQSFIGP